MHGGDLLLLSAANEMSLRFGQQHVILYSYPLWLIGRIDCNISLDPAARGHRPLVLHVRIARPAYRFCHRASPWQRGALCQ
jgi:hypothetical protein